MILWLPGESCGGEGRGGREGGREEGREWWNGIVEEEVSRRRGTAVPTVITILCTNIQHCTEHVVQTNL